MTMDLPFQPPVAPMLAKLSEAIPVGDGWLFEPKWDGFRALVFRDPESLLLQSRDLKPLNRYFPELEAPLAEQLPEHAVLDGEIVIAGPNGLDFDSLLLRIHPAASRVKLLAGQTPASLVVWDLLALGQKDLRNHPLEERRARLEELTAKARPPLYLTPATRDRALAQEWFLRFEGAGLDGVVAKRLDGVYEPDKRAMVKVKHRRTADCVVGGFRWHKNGQGTHVGSLLLGLHDDEGTLHFVGVTAAFTMARRKELAKELEPLRKDALEGHPWAGWMGEEGEPTERRPGEGWRRAPAKSPQGGMTSRWNRGKDLSWVPLRLERVCEVAYDHLQGTRFRHATQFQRWRPDKRPKDCRFDQLETTTPYELAQIFGDRA